jgi:hypothetical protein
MTGKSVGLVVLAMAIALLGATRANALSLRETNIVDLLKEADAIVVAEIGAVTDGIDEKGVPYTEVKLEVKESIRGNISGTYTFRQFGLVKPRPMPGGKLTMMPAPEGFPRYTAGQTNLLFFHPVAAWSGLRTTARLGYGKFTLGAGRAENEMGNAGLFSNVNLDQRLTTESDKRLLTSQGAANPDSLLSFVRRAVNEHWVETGRLAGRAHERVTR